MDIWNTNSGLCISEGLEERKFLTLARIHLGGATRRALGQKGRPELSSLKKGKKESVQKCNIVFNLAEFILHVKKIGSSRSVYLKKLLV